MSFFFENATDMNSVPQGSRSILRIAVLSLWAFASVSASSGHLDLFCIHIPALIVGCMMMMVS